MDSNYRVQEFDMCCGNCQFAVDEHHFLNGYTELTCGHKLNANSRGLMEVEENGICNYFIAPYDISEEKFKEQLAEQLK